MSQVPYRLRYAARPDNRMSPIFRNPGRYSWGAFDLPESESGFEIMILSHRLIERIGNRISNLVDHTRFMILSESIIRDGVLHHFICANQKYDSETSKSYSVQVSK